jgi:aspartyl-tRNA(Asn)/glutamyl-tRNA(Gln) amidotransferase subunit A
MLPFAVGTDAGGSIRQPAAYTGVVGFKPSAGRLPRRHGFPALVLDFQVIGLMSRSVRDIEVGLRVMAGPDPRDRASLGFGTPTDGKTRPLRVAYVSEIAGHPVEPEIAGAVARAAVVMESLGHAVLPLAKLYDPDMLRSFWSTLSAAGVARALRGHPRWQDQVTPFIHETASRGLAIGAADYVDALDLLAQFRVETAEVVEPYDLVLTPTSPVFPWPIEGQPPSTIAGRPTDSRTPMAFTTFVNATGYPAVSLPCGVSSAGLPIGLQLVAQFGQESLLLRSAAAFEEAAPWREHRPPLFAS